MQTIVAEWNSQILNDPHAVDRGFNWNELNAIGKHSNLFNIQCVLISISKTNFIKGMGPDGLTGGVSNDHKTLFKVAEQVLEWLNTGSFPEYLREGRLILLNKSRGDEQNM